MKRVIVAFGLLACSAPHGRDATWEVRSRALRGHWAVQFQYAAGEPVNGAFDLAPNGTIDHEYPRIGLPTNYGTYAVHFRDLGGPPAGSRVPAVVAGFVADDSVVVLFETDREMFSMQMRGTLSGDTLRGTWAAAQSRGRIAAGTFTMIRQ